MKIKNHTLTLTKLVPSIGLMVLILLVASSHVYAASTPPVTGNLILNPQMLDATVSSTTPDHWVHGGFGATTTYTYPTIGPLSDDKAAQVDVSAISSGAAEWVFDTVPVTPNATYAFSDWYNSNVDSYLVVQWTLSGSVLKFESIATLDPTGGAWVRTPQEVFTAPANAVSMTIFHQLQSEGILSTSNYAIVPFVPSDQDALSEGIVSLTFDDGWTTQYDNAWPILNAGNLPATFYIYTNPVKAASYDIFADPNESILTNTTTNGVIWSDIFPDPTNQIYRFGDTYQSDGTSTIMVTFIPQGGATSTVSTVLSVSASPTRSSYVFTLPVLASSTPLTISHTGAQAITATAPVLNEYGSGYMSYSQVLDLQAAGNEIGAHTTDHCNLFQLNKDPNLATIATGQCVPTLASSTTAQTEINNSKIDLQSNGVSPNTFAYPYGAYDSGVKSLISSDGFSAARTVDIGYNTKQSDPLALKAMSVGITTAIADVENWINYAKANKVWLVLVFHQVDSPAALASNGEDGGTTPQDLQQIVDYLNNQSVSVKTVQQALSLLTASTTNATSTPTTTPPIATTTPPTTPPTATITVTTNPRSSGGSFFNSISNTNIKIGDLNNDGKVDLLDFNLLIINWGQTGSGLAGDINHDGAVDLSDFNTLIINWG